MARQKFMRRFARWHIWLGWLVGLPILMWTVTGLIMVWHPIEEVRGNHLRSDASQIDISLPPSIALSPELDLAAGNVERIEIAAPLGTPVLLATSRDGSVARFDAVSGERLPRLDEAAAKRVALLGLADSRQPVTAQFFEADHVPFDFRRPMPVWQITTEDGTHVYVGADTGRVEAVRTRFWRIFDFAWGLHIMDLETREDTSHPLLIGFAFLGVIGSLLGCVLMFRRRRARTRVAP
ncbi:PepSY domain-containing protein [Aurantiacibacter aquimixticola]|uniref:PepSY domain-containing protein n=1 Tax=Aurantiacibacter aquimixticola TaxID=1958945 RepID=A0A419RT11_9SPHN|nr:PepSY domain-containing protein [Aurantiacibacter aquimixticola]RJY08909.1 hypothetical protein D6201_05645 [Aurantiacibacter aquimixticola]